MHKLVKAKRQNGVINAAPVNLFPAQFKIFYLFKYLKILLLLTGFWKQASDLIS